VALVVDVSVAAKWFLADESSAFAESILDRIVKESAYVPALFIWEFQNVLLVAGRAERLTPRDVDEALETLTTLPIFVDPVQERALAGTELQLARHYDLTAYDAAYLALAARKRIALATTDKRLRNAAADAGIEVLSP